MKKLLMLSFGLLLLCSLSAQTNLVKNPSFQTGQNAPGTNSNIFGTDQGYTQGSGDFSNLGMDIDDWIGRYDIKGVDGLGGKQYWVSDSGTDFDCLSLEEDDPGERFAVVASGNSSDCNSSTAVNTTKGLIQSELLEELENDEKYFISFRWRPNLVDEAPPFFDINIAMTSHENKFRNNLSQQTVGGIGHQSSSGNVLFSSELFLQEAAELGYMPWLPFNDIFFTEDGWFKNQVKYVNIIGGSGSYAVDNVVIYKCDDYVPEPNFEIATECIGGELENVILNFSDMSNTSEIEIDIRELDNNNVPLNGGMDITAFYFPGFDSNNQIDLSDFETDNGFPIFEWNTGSRYRFIVNSSNRCNNGTRTKILQEDCIVEPPSINVNLSVYPCEGDNQSPGFITATVSGGVAPYSYQINSGNPITSNNTSHTFNNIYQGNYTIAVTDAQGLTASKNTTVVCQFAPDPGTSDKNTKVAEDREDNSFDLNSTTKDGKSTLSCSPNPASDLITISYHLPKESNTKLLLVNAQGSIISTVQNFQYKAAGDHQVDLSIQSLAPGMYFLLLDAGDNRPVTKFIKQ